MKTILKSITAIAACFVLTSCWVPENFTATLNVDKAKNFKFTLVGTIVYAPALGVIKANGRLNSDAEAEIKKAETELRKQSGFKKADYLGNGRFKIEFEQTGPVEAGKKVFLDLVEFRVSDTGRISVLGAEITEEARQQFAALNFKLDGTLKVTTDLPVVKHNASSTPSLGGWIGAYTWKITNSQTERPEIVLQP